MLEPLLPVGSFAVRRMLEFLPAVETGGGGGDPEPLQLTNEQKLALPPSTPVGTRVDVTDGFYLSDPASGAENLFLFPSGSTNGKPRYLSTSEAWNNGGGGIVWTGNNWADANGSYSSDDTPTFLTATDEHADHDGWSIIAPAPQVLAAPGRGALLVSGGLLNDVYTRRGLLNDRSYYNRQAVQSSNDSGSFGDIIFWSPDGGPDDTPAWFIRDHFSQSVYYSSDDVATPDLVTAWKEVSDGSSAGITVALTDPQGGVFVTGGTQDGLYSIRPFTSNGKPIYSLLGAPDNDGFSTIVSYGSLWIIYDSNSEELYRSSASNAATPDLATDWINVSDEGPAPITVTSILKGKMDAGVSVTGAGTETSNGAFALSGVSAEFGSAQSAAFEYSKDDGARKISYTRYAESRSNFWAILEPDLEEDNSYRSTTVRPFPWEDAWIADLGEDPAPTVTRNDVAAEANWHAAV